MSEATHTPLPWTFGGGKYIPINATTRDGRLAQIGRLESFGHISDAEVEANAALVDRAVNCHDELVELAEFALEVASHNLSGKSNHPLAVAARRALAKATAEPTKQGRRP